ncbi:MAG: tripartite tricarboxylate transporter substrate binding protein [Candidatus Methanomethylicaceae archaeon]
MCQEALKYPTKAIDLIIAFGPGTGFDTTGRMVAAYLSKKWGVPINPVNMTGGSGVTALNRVIRSAPDGYTMFLDGHVLSSMLFAIQPDLPFKLNERTFIAQLTIEPVFFVVNSNSPWKTLKEVLDAARKDPANFRSGCGALGSLNNFSISQLLFVAGIDPNSTARVIFEQGNVAALQALLGGHVQFGIVTTSDMERLGSAGKIRGLAVTTPERLKDFPDIPTTKEAGVPGSDIIGWYGISGPPSLPPYIVETWSKALEEMVRDKEFQVQAAKMKKYFTYLPPKETKEMVNAEYEKYVSLAKKIGLRK